MPIVRCQKEGKPGWKWGENGTCYVYSPGDPASEARAKIKAKEQAAAILMSQGKRSVMDREIDK